MRAVLDESACMNENPRPRALCLLRLIVELKGSEMPSNDVFLTAISEQEPEVIAEDLAALERAGLISWSERGEQWTPTMRGLLLGINLPAYEPNEFLLDDETAAECA
jgi:hypothetical protein